MLGYADIAIFKFINNTLANPIFDAIMAPLTRLGSGELIFVIAVLLVIFGKKEKKMAGILLIAGLSVTYYVVEFLKGTLAINRPFVTIADARLLVPKSSGYSFPSGHTVTAFMAATIVSRYYRPRAIWFTLALMVAFSRIYVGAHYASDVVAGACIGIMIGYGLVRIARNSNSG